MPAMALSPRSPRHWLPGRRRGPRGNTLLGAGQIERRHENPRFPLIEHGLPGYGQKIGTGRKSGYHLVEGNRAAAGNQAIRFALRALVEAAQPAEVAIGCRLEQKYIRLMSGDAGPSPGFISRSQDKVAGTAQFTQPAEGIEPDGEIEIFAFMPNLATPSP